MPERKQKNKSILQLLDKNQDGKVSESEWRAGLSSKEFTGGAYSKGFSPISLLQLKVGVGDLNLKARTSESPPLSMRKPKREDTQAHLIRKARRSSRKNKNVFNVKFK